jgi:hypothetical protein
MRTDRSYEDRFWNRLMRATCPSLDFQYRKLPLSHRLHIRDRIYDGIAIRIRIRMVRMRNRFLHQWKGRV